MLDSPDLDNRVLVTFEKRIPVYTERNGGKCFKITVTNIEYFS